MLIDIRLKVGDFHDSHSLNADQREFDELEEFITKIVQTSIDGLHLIKIDSDFINWLFEKNEEGKISLTNSHKFHIENVMHRRNKKIRSAVKNSNVVFQVYSNGKFDKKVADGKIIYSIGFRELNQSNYMNLPKILVEDVLSDGEFYKLILDSVNKWKGVKIRYDPVVHHGGGNRIIVNLRNLVKEGYIVTCYCDNDTAGPNDFITGLCKEIQGEFKKTDVCGAQICTIGRSIENFLSFDTILKVLTIERDNCGAQKNKGDFNENEISNAISKTEKLIEDCSNGKINQDDIKFINLKKAIECDIIKNFNLCENRDIILKTQLDETYWKTNISNWLDPFVWYYCGRNKKRTSNTHSSLKECS